MADAILTDVRIVTVRTLNWAEMVRYYSETLGLKRKFSDSANEYAMFEAGSIRIAIEGPVKPAYRRVNGAGATMMNFEVDNLETALEELRGRGAQVLTEVRQGPGYDYVAVSDPEGNEHIVYQRTPMD
jgi:predicted enzyme related to lactoylglutathione lyase